MHFAYSLYHKDFEVLSNQHQYFVLVLIQFSLHTKEIFQSQYTLNKSFISSLLSFSDFINFLSILLIIIS